MNADEKRVGEKYRYHIKGEDIHSYNAVSDRDVQEGREFLTKAFGVRITNIKDLDALDVGIEEYYARPEKGDIPREAVHRAVLLKKTFFPYQIWKWNIDNFNRIPYAAPIPNLKYGAPPLEAKDLNLYLPDTGITEPQLPLPIPSASEQNSGETVVSPTLYQRAYSYAINNWWLLLMPIPVAIAIAVIAQYRKK